MTFREQGPIPSPRRWILIGKPTWSSHFPDITLANEMQEEINEGGSVEVLIGLEKTHKTQGAQLGSL